MAFKANYQKPKNRKDFERLSSSWKSEKAKVERENMREKKSLKRLL